MKAPDLTLKEARKEAKERVFRVSDFLSQKEVEELHENNKTKHIKPKFDLADAYIAEIMSRFGYDAYRAWKCGDIEQETMNRLIEAERARDARERILLETIIVASCAGANRPTKSGHLPKTIRLAIKMLSDERKKAGL